MSSDPSSLQEDSTISDVIVCASPGRHRLSPLERVLTNETGTEEEGEREMNRSGGSPQRSPPSIEHGVYGDRLENEASPRRHLANPFELRGDYSKQHSLDGAAQLTADRLELLLHHSHPLEMFVKMQQLQQQQQQQQQLTMPFDPFDRSLRAGDGRTFMKTVFGDSSSTSERRPMERSPPPPPPPPTLLGCYGGLFGNLFSPMDEPWQQHYRRYLTGGTLNLLTPQPLLTPLHRPSLRHHSTLSRFVPYGLFPPKSSAFLTSDTLRPGNTCPESHRRRCTSPSRYGPYPVRLSSPSSRPLPSTSSSSSSSSPSSSFSPVPHIK